jgi:hypothetical protein
LAESGLSLGGGAALLDGERRGDIKVEKAAENGVVRASMKRMERWEEKDKRLGGG